MVDVEKIKLATQLGKSSSSKRFGENVCKLMTHWNVLHFDDLRLYLLTDEVTVNLDMLGFVVINWIFSNVEGGLIVA